MQQTATDEQTKIKAFTAAGAVISRYTMHVKIKPEFQRVRESTGELINCWTYRSDLVQQHFKKLKREYKPLDALAWYYKSIKHRITECKVYDNSLPAPDCLIFHEANGIVIFQKNRNEL